MRVLLAPFFVMGACGAMTWWYLMPRGFPVAHPRFWANSILPSIAAATCLLGLLAIVRKWDGVLKCLVLVLGTLVAVAGIAGKCYFPESVSGAILIALSTCLVITLLVVGSALWIMRRTPVAAWSKAACICAGTIAGIFLPWSQRAMDSATKPFSRDILTPSSTRLEDSGDPLSLSDRITVSPGVGRVRLESGGTTLDVYPLLSFQSRSPDRCWTLLAPPSTNVWPPRSLVGLSREAGGITLDYEDDGHSRLKIGLADREESVTIEALSHLPHDVYSHLNTFCELHVSGSGSLALSFSPCSDVVEMKPSDYPVGRPARLAYWDVNNVFHVVEARSGEKGPYRELTRGMLKRDEPLQITIHNDKKAAWRITLSDWARQASRQLSPTAGWGLPENAIEFSLSCGGESCRGLIFMTLANTSTGRGWDSVGHAAGTYRNAMRIEPVPRTDQDAPTDRAKPRR